MKTDEFAKLREQLNAVTWPNVYMFKFITPSDPKSYALVRQLFPSEAEISEKNSKNGKYISLTVKEMMLSAEEVIERYKKALAIEGVIVL